MSSSSGFPSSPVATAGSSAMPQIGHAPGSVRHDLRVHRADPLREEEDEEEEREEDFLEGEEGRRDGGPIGAGFAAGNVSDGSPMPGGVVIGSNDAPLFAFEENLSGSLLNFSAQPFAQKYQSLSPQ